MDQQRSSKVAEKCNTTGNARGYFLLALGTFRRYIFKPLVSIPPFFPQPRPLWCGRALTGTATRRTAPGPSATGSPCGGTTRPYLSCRARYRTNWQARVCFQSFFHSNLSPAIPRCCPRDRPVRQIDAPALRKTKSWETSIATLVRRPTWSASVSLRHPPPQLMLIHMVIFFIKTCEK